MLCKNRRLRLLLCPPSFSKSRVAEFVSFRFVTVEEMERERERERERFFIIFYTTCSLTFLFRYIPFFSTISKLPALLFHESLKNLVLLKLFVCRCWQFKHRFVNKNTKKKKKKKKEKEQCGWPQTRDPLAKQKSLRLLQISDK